MTTYTQKITFGELRGTGVHNVLVVYCRDHKCSHRVGVCADRWPDHLRLSDIEPSFTCTACGKRGADVRPAHSRARRVLLSPARSSFENTTRRATGGGGSYSGLQPLGCR